MLMPSRTGILNRLTVAGGHPPPADFQGNTARAHHQVSLILGSKTTERKELRGRSHALSRGKGSDPARDKGADIGQVFYFTNIGILGYNSTNSLTLSGVPLQQLSTSWM